MDKELIIDVSPTEVSIALLEDKRLVELHKEKNNKNYAVGDIYLGKIKKTIPGLNAAFVNIGYERDAFLHYLDLGPQVNSLKKFTKQTISNKNFPVTLEHFSPEANIEKTGKISNVFSPNQQVLVQIAKEPISTKGPRVTSEIALAGRYLVLVPFSNRVSISQKIKNIEERSRLRRLVQSIKPKNFGVIIRTVAENKKVADLIADLKDLLEKWKTAAAKLPGAKPPAKILGELSRTSTILRDILNKSFQSIKVNNQVLYDEICNFLRTIAPGQIDIVKFYKGRAPIFEHFGVDKQIKRAFGKIVTIKSGVYLIIEHTEAMHVIDVNSGNRMNTEQNQESNALEVNLEAADEIARQLRLRDMGGIIVIDFIDMSQAANRRKLYERLKELMKQDRAKHSIIPPSKFGLIQITRQRVRPEMNVDILERCPMCEGTGEIKPSIILIDEIENNIRYLLQEQNEPGVKLSVHPYINAYLKKGLFPIQWEWFFKYRKWISIKKVSSYHLLEYHFFNKMGDEIKI